MRHLAYVNGSNRCDRIADSVLVIPSPRFLARRGYDTDAIRRVVRTLVGELDSWAADSNKQSPRDRGDAAIHLQAMRTTMRGWFGRLIEVVAVAVAGSLSASRWASPAAAQTPSPARAHTIDMWAAGSLGFADLGEHGGLAGHFALSTAIDGMVITLRAAGAGEYSEQAADRTYGDVALLVGMRATHPRIPVPGKVGGTTASISLGLARLYYDQPPLAGSPERSGVVPAIAFDADLMAHLRVIGVGVSMFGAAGTNNRYLGAGLTLALGKIR